MLRKLQDLRGYAIRATDGLIGKVDDFYFDDEDWGIRYLVVDTGNWLSRRKVLISPIVLGHAGWMARQLPVSLTRAQVEHSPDFDTRKPVSRQQEAEYFRYYGYPYYWGGAGLWGMGAYPGSLTTAGRVEEELKAQQTHSSSTSTDCHLRSSNAVTGHRIEATDGHIGHVEDLLVDDYTWAIGYLIVNTSSWLGGHRVLVAPKWIRDVSWSEARVSVDLTRQAVSDSPPYESIAQLDDQRYQQSHQEHSRVRNRTTHASHERRASRVHHAASAAHKRRQS
jgi:PRC-barrel domain protein